MVCKNGQLCGFGLCDFGLAQYMALAMEQELLVALIEMWPSLYVLFSILSSLFLFLIYFLLSSHFLLKGDVVALVEM